MKYFCWKGILVLLFYNFFILIFDMKILKHTINFKVWLYPDRKIRIQPKIPDPTGSATLVIAMQYLPTVGSGIRWTRYFFLDPDPDSLKNKGSGSAILFIYFIG